MADLTDSKYLGKWKGVSVTLLGNTEPLTVESVIALNADGTATYTSPEEVKEYTWTEKSYGVYLDGKSDLKLTYDDGMLKTRIMGFVTVNFEKQS